jgi:hypothetical protein
MTISDLLDKQKMIAWLAHDGKPPTVAVETAASRQRWGYRSSVAARSEVKPVADEETLDLWWRRYRDDLTADWIKSPANPHKPQTWTQFVGDCLRAIGIKGGKVQDRVKKAVAAFPEIYQSV